MTAYYRHACPRNCYSTCSMISTVKDGIITKVEGDRAHGYTKGALCAKGYAYTQYVYSPYRLRYPMRQIPRNSGNWVRISWEEAYQLITDKILELNSRYKNNLAIGYNKFSGNLGVLHYAVEAMFSSFGPHTKSTGNPCNLSGENALKKIIGGLESISPESMKNSDCIVIWGANPCVTNIHQMKFIFEAQDKGAKFIVIDPLFTQTASHADIYIQIHPKTDYLLAIGISKYLIEEELVDIAFLQTKIDNLEEYIKKLNSYSFNEICSKTKVSMEVLKLIATSYIQSKNPATWIGFGIQRYSNGENTVGSIYSMGELINSINKTKDNIFYGNYMINAFPLNLLNFREKEAKVNERTRELNLNNFAKEALSLEEPPLKMLWIASRNPLSQDTDLDEWKKLLEQLELVVMVDLFLNQTSEYADIILPAASHFEEYDLNISYWNNWLTFNEKAISSFFEAKSDLQITRELVAYLNKKSPGFSTFPIEKDPLDWIKEEISENVKEIYSMDDFSDLKIGPKKLIKPVKKLQSNLKLFIPEKVEEEPQEFQYRLLTPQSLLTLHSQYDGVPWLKSIQEEPLLEISPMVAEKEGLYEGEKVRIYNNFSFLYAFVKFNAYLPKDVIVISQAGKTPINQIIAQNSSPKKKQSAHFYDSYVGIEKVEG